MWPGEFLFSPQSQKETPENGFFEEDAAIFLKHKHCEIYGIWLQDTNKGFAVLQLDYTNGVKGKPVKKFYYDSERSYFHWLHTQKDIETILSPQIISKLTTHLKYHIKK